MESLQTFAVFFGWSTIINSILLLITTFAVTALRIPIQKIHSKLFGLTEIELSSMYFQFLANYKLAIIVLNFVPYLVVKIMI